LLLVAAVALSAGVLAAWFPAGALLSQRKALSSASAQLQQLKVQDQQLRQEKALLSQPNEIARIARQQYELVTPGERAYQVLPPSGSSSSSGAPSEDPGSQPIVSPNAETVLSLGDPPVGTAATPSASTTTGPTTTGTPNSTTSTSTPPVGSRSGHAAAPRAVAASSGGSLWDRMVQTLEFWR
jgi:cell division protein FtsB